MDRGARCKLCWVGSPGAPHSADSAAMVQPVGPGGGRGALRFAGDAAFCRDRSRSRSHHLSDGADASACTPATHGKTAMKGGTQLTGSTANQLNQEELARLQAGNFANPPAPPPPPSR